MKHYKRYDNAPMKFYKFCAVTNLPLFMFFAIALIQSHVIIRVYDDSDVAMAFVTIEMFIAFCAYIGLYKKIYWGYVVGEAFAIVGSVTGFALFVLGIYRLLSGYAGGTEMLVAGIAIMIPNTLMSIYFEKRRYLFKDVPNIFDVPIYTYAAEACYICTLHLNGTTSERVGYVSKFNFDYSKFLDKTTGMIYFREEVRNGQIVNVAVTREKWKEAAAKIPRHDHMTGEQE